MNRVSHENAILALLDRLLQQPAVVAVIEPIASRVAAQLLANPTVPLTWEPVPLDTYGGELPNFIRSSWVFVLRGNSASGAERHPNSHQRVAAYRGDGDLQIRLENQWESHFLTPDPLAPLESRWASIPPNVWHQAVVHGMDWIVVSFHTVADSELIEERPDETNTDSYRKRKYLK